MRGQGGAVAVFESVRPLPVRGKTRCPRSAAGRLRIQQDGWLCVGQLPTYSVRTQHSSRWRVMHRTRAWLRAALAWCSSAKGYYDAASCAVRRCQRPTSYCLRAQHLGTGAASRSGEVMTATKGALQCLRGFERIEDGLGDTRLVFDRESNEVSLGKRTARGLASRRHDEVGERASLKLGRSLERGVHLWRKTEFDSSRGSFGCHAGIVRHSERSYRSVIIEVILQHCELAISQTCKLAMLHSGVEHP
jgi:hypothetical protein